MRVLVVNAGSSSLKLRLIGPGDDVEAADDLSPPPAEGDLAGVLAGFIGRAQPPDAVGHRIVHGGARFSAPLLLDEAVDEVLEALADLAPLHNPRGLAPVRALGRLFPSLPQVACFDTAFHAKMGEAAATYALPERWRAEWGIKKFGFHGFSHAWASRRAAQLLHADPDTMAAVVAHLGSGASLAAVVGRRSVDTTMGFTPLDGLVMATRSGSVDPGALLWVQRHRGLDTAAVEEDLEQRSGLLGLSGSADLRAVMEGAGAGDERCRLAYEVYVHRIATLAGAMAVAAGSLDALVFTGGAGEASSALRSDVCTRLGVLGVRAPATGPGPDPQAGPEPDAQAGNTDRVLVAGAAGRPAVLVVRSREDLEIAGNVRALLGG